MKKLVTGCTCVVAAFALLAAGCGETENALTAADRELIDTANSGMNISEELVNLATNAIIENGTGGSIKSIRGKAEAPTAISFNGTVNATIDLDADHGSGDAFPYWTGIVGISASGSVIDNGDSGSVTYTVDITRNTDITVTNKNTVNPMWTSATAPAGPGLQFELAITWTVTDANNCLITISFDAARSDANALPLTIETPGGTITAVLDEAIHNALTLGASAGELVFSASVSGHREVEWTVDTETHTVRVAVDLGVSFLGDTETITADSWILTVDGVEFGPYTTLEFALAILFAQ